MGNASWSDPAVVESVITGSIHLVRGQKVMLDRDLARLYGVETKHLKRQVQRNRERFPEDFMFALTARELAALRYQIGTSNDLSATERGGSRVLPMAFTEQGVAMLSSVLKSERAVQVNIRIMRVFIRTREVLEAHKDILHKLERLEEKVALHDEGIGTLFEHIRELLTPAPAPPRQRIGYKQEHIDQPSNGN